MMVDQRISVLVTIALAGLMISNCLGVALADAATMVVALFVVQFLSLCIGLRSLGGRSPIPSYN
jgi:hypothetical protein